MELASATRPRHDTPLERASSRSRRGPLLALTGGLFALAVAAGLIAAHVTVFALDETLIEQSAVHYTSGLPHSLFHDLDARATNRLYPLVLSIALRQFAGAQALRIDHILSVLLFVSAGVPIFLFARAVLRSSWLAVAAALLSIAVPWLTLTSALFTENLAYPLFWWAILAASAALWRPAPGRDALALLSIALLVATRVQFAALFAGYLLALLLRGYQLAQVRERGAARLRAALTGVVRGYPLSLLLTIGLAAFVVYEKASGQWQARVEGLLGSYSNVVIRSGLSANMGEGLLIELIALALGVGLLPAIVSLAWFVRRMAHPRLDRAWVYVAGSAIVMVVFLLLTVYSQGGYLGPITEERYFFYVIPVFWLGAFAAIEDRQVRAADLLLVAVGFALLYASIPFLSPLNQEAAFLDPVESIVPHVLSRRFGEVGLNGLSMQDALAGLAIVGGAFAAWLWSRDRARVWWVVGVGAGTQLLLCGYAFAVIDGKITGILGRTDGSVAALGWVDSHAGGDVAWLDNLSSAAPPTTLASPSADQLRTTLFWNSSVRSWVRLPQTALPPVEVPMAPLPGVEALVNPRTGALTPASSVASLKYVVGATSSPFLQLQGTPLAQSPDGVLTLTRPTQPVRVAWVAYGLQPDGGVLAASSPRIAAFAAGEPSQGRTGTALRAVLTFAPPAPPADASGSPRTVLGVRLGEANAHVELTAGGRPVRTRLTTCIAPQVRRATGTIAVLRAPANAVAGALQSVVLGQGGACNARPRSGPPARP